MCRNTDKRKEGGKQLTVVVVVVNVVVVVVVVVDYAVVVVVVVVLISIPIEVMSLWKTTRGSDRPGHHCQWIKADRPGSLRQLHCWYKCACIVE